MIQLEKVSSSKSQRSDKSNMFVFKVIHDLRHPIEAQKNVMNQLLSDTQKMANLFFSHFNSQNEKYVIRQKVQNALK